MTSNEAFDIQKDILTVDLQINELTTTLEALRVKLYQYVETHIRNHAYSADDARGWMARSEIPEVKETK